MGQSTKGMSQQRGRFKVPDSSGGLLTDEMRSATPGGNDAHRKLSQRSIVRSLPAGAAQACLPGILDAVGCSETGGGLAGGPWEFEPSLTSALAPASSASPVRCSAGADSLGSNNTHRWSRPQSHWPTCSISAIASALSRATLGAVPAPVGDAYYFFNPFGEYWLGADYPTEADADVTGTR